MIRASRGRKGFALALAIAAMVVIGTLITGIFFASTQEYRLGRNALLQARALTAAELGLLAVATPLPAGRWDPIRFAALAPGATAPPIELLPGDGSIDTVRVTRLDDVSYLLVSEGRAGSERGARARRRIASLVRLRVPSLPAFAALTVRGPLDIADSALVDGSDSTLAGAPCPSPGAALPGIATSDSTGVSTAACTTPPCVLGAPAVSASTAAADTASYFVFGDTDWRELSGSADKVVGPTPIAGLAPSLNGDGSCNVGDPRNWGDPSRGAVAGGCEAYYPVVYAPGDLHLAGGVGQGVLLVEGDLELSGGAQFFGPVVVRGRLTTSGAGGKITGAVLVANSAAARNVVGGNTHIRYSSCALARALAGSARPAGGAAGSWNELF